MPTTILENVPGMATASPVPVLQAETLKESVFRSEYVAHSRPCVIKGAVAHWPATRKWRDRDYLKRICGRDKVHYWPHENHLTARRADPGVLRMAFADAVARLHDAKPHEMGSIGCNPGTPEMAVDLRGFPFFGGGEPGFNYSSIRLFMFRNAGTTWHYHSFDETLMCQVVGNKKVGLLKVDNAYHPFLRNIFFREDYYEDPSVFGVLEGADLQWFCADLEDGDALYIPPLWWHGVAVTSDRPGVTAPVVWRSPPHVIADSLRKMAAGRFEMIGDFIQEELGTLMAMARNLGLAREFETAWKFAVAHGLIAMTDHFGNRWSPKPTWPPV